MKRFSCPFRNKKLSLFKQGLHCIRRFGAGSSPCPDTADEKCTYLPFKKEDMKKIKFVKIPKPDGYNKRLIAFGKSINALGKAIQALDKKLNKGKKK